MLTARFPVRRYVVAAAGMLLSSVAAAQTSQRDSSQTDTVASAVASAVVSSTKQMPPLLTRKEGVVAGLTAAATIVIAHLDHPIDGELQEQNLQRNTLLRKTTRDLAFLGGPGPFVLGPGFYLIGRIGRIAPVTDIGIHLTESVLLAAAITGLGKGISGCALPNVKTSHDCQWGRGFHHGNGPFVSFPSGHTAAGFAMAAATTSEVDGWHPGWGRYVGPLAYATAGCIGLARLYQNVHWASDLPLGAAIGTWSGLTIVAHAHARTGNKVGNKVERVLSSMNVFTTPSSATVLGWSLPFGS